MVDTDREIKIIRDLAKRVAEIASDPVHEEKKQLWTKLNRLERVRPLIHVQAIDKSIWSELLPEDQFQCEDPFMRKQEEMLRRKIYCWEHFKDDRVVDDVVPCRLVIQGDSRSTVYGIPIKYEKPDMEYGAKKIIPMLKEEKDIDMIQTDPKVWVDWDETEKNYTRLSELYDDILRVEKKGVDFFGFGFIDIIIRWRGIEQTFVDLIERPSWIHDLLGRMSKALISSCRQLEELGLLSRGDGNTMLGSGGYGWTDQLPKSDFDGKRVRLKDIWARAATQIFTEVISPEVHDEFAIRYEKPLLELFGLTAYGCCEPLHNKLKYVKKIGNLRRISLSPWVDIDKAASEVGMDYVYTHKPNPSLVSMSSWDLEIPKQELKKALEKTRGNVVEVNLQDLHTVQNQPQRLTEWAEMAFDLAEQYAN